MAILSASDLTLERNQPQRSTLWLSIYQPTTILSAQVSNPLATQGNRFIPYVNASGSYTNITPNMTMLAGTQFNQSDLGRTRVRYGTPSGLVIAENSDIAWASGTYITVLNYVDVVAIYPRIVQPTDPKQNLIFYKDYDILYTNQNTVLGSFPNMGPHRASFLIPGGAGQQTQLYWSSSGTYNVIGDALSFSWIFEGGTPATSTARDPGWVTYNTPGHYKTLLTISGSMGSVDQGYRFVSIYDRPENGVHTPILQWEITEFSGSRGQGGYTAKIRVRDTKVAGLRDNALVVLFTDDWYGTTNKSIGGNAENCSSIFFTGYIQKGSIYYNYMDNYVEFDLCSVSQLMKDSQGFSVSVQDNLAPSTWFQMANMTILKAIYGCLKWHSTVLNVADFVYTGDDRQVQYFDSDRGSLYDSVAKFLETGVLGELVTDRQGQLWAEITRKGNTMPRTSYPLNIILTNTDWIETPQIDQREYDDVSYYEMGGVAYTGLTGTSAAYLACAPGQAPGYRGQIKNLEGLILLSQTQLNQLVGSAYADENSQFPTVTIPLRGNYRGLDIAPIEQVQLSLKSSDTPEGVVLNNEPFNVEQMDWTYDAEWQSLYTHSVQLAQLVAGVPGSTIAIPPVTALGLNGGFNVPGFSIPPLPQLVWPPIMGALLTGSVGSIVNAAIASLTGTFYSVFTISVNSVTTVKQQGAGWGTPTCGGGNFTITVPTAGLYAVNFTGASGFPAHTSTVTATIDSTPGTEQFMPRATTHQAYIYGTGNAIAGKVIPVPFWSYGDSANSEDWSVSRTMYLNQGDTITCVYTGTDFGTSDIEIVKLAN